MPDDLSGLSRVELHKAEAACEFLLELHREHQVAGGELAAGLGALLSDVRLAQQDRARQRRDEAAGQADPPPNARMARMRASVDAQLVGVPRQGAVSFALSAQLLAMALTEEQADAVIQLAIELVKGNPVAVAALEMTGAMLDTRLQDGPPPEYLAVTGLDEVSWRELAARRTWLLAVIAAAGPGADQRGAEAGALVLAAVIAEQAARARSYAAHGDGLRWCRCGFQCRGLAGIDDHLDQFDLDDDSHYEVVQPPGGDGDRMSGLDTNHVLPGPLSRRPAA